MKPPPNAGGGRELLSPMAAVLWIVGVALVITLAVLFW